MMSAYLRRRNAYTSGGYGERLGAQARRIIACSAPLNGNASSDELWRYDEGASHVARACECYIEHYTSGAPQISEPDDRPVRFNERFKAFERDANSLHEQFSGMIDEIDRLIETSHPAQARKAATLLNMLHAAYLGLIAVQYDGSAGASASFQEVQVPFVNYKFCSPEGTVDFGAYPGDFTIKFDESLEVTKDGLRGLASLKSLANLAKALHNDVTLDIHVAAAKPGGGRPRWASRADFIVDLAIAYELVWRKTAQASSYGNATAVTQTSFARLVDAAFTEMRLVSAAVPAGHLSHRAIDAAIKRARDSEGVLILGKRRRD